MLSYARNGSSVYWLRCLLLLRVLTETVVVAFLDIFQISMQLMQSICFELTLTYYQDVYTQFLHLFFVMNAGFLKPIQEMQNI